MISNGAGHRDREAAPPPPSILRPSSGGVKENLSLLRGLGRFHAPQYPGQKTRGRRRAGHLRPEFPTVTRELRASATARCMSARLTRTTLLRSVPAIGQDSPATQAETGSHGRMLLVHRCRPVGRATANAILHTFRRVLQPAASCRARRSHPGLPPAFVLKRRTCPRPPRPRDSMKNRKQSFNSQAHLMSFELIPLAPLNPLRQLQGMTTDLP